MTASDPLDEELADRRIAAGENGIPPAAAVLFAAVVYALLPQSLLVAPRFAIPIIELALLAAPVATNPRRIVRQSRWSRIGATASAGLVIVANLAALGMLIARLVASSTSGGALLLGAMQAWITNVIGFGLLFLGARPRRSRRSTEAATQELPPANWRFSQDENDDAVVEASGRIEQEVRLDPNICRLPLRVPDQLQRLQPDRHDAADQSRQGVDGATGHRRATHLLDRHRPRRRVARRWKRLTAAERSGQAATNQHPC